AAAASRAAREPAASPPPEPPGAAPPPPRTGSLTGLVEVGGLGASGTTFVPRAWLERALATGNDATTAHPTTAGSTTNAFGMNSAGMNGSVMNGSGSGTGTGTMPTTGRAGRADSTRDLTCDGVTGALLAGDVPEALASG